MVFRNWVFSVCLFLSSRAHAIHCSEIEKMPSPFRWNRWTEYHQHGVQIPRWEVRDALSRLIWPRMADSALVWPTRPQVGSDDFPQLDSRVISYGPLPSLIRFDSRANSTLILTLGRLKNRKNGVEVVILSHKTGRSSHFSVSLEHPEFDPAILTDPNTRYRVTPGHSVWVYNRESELGFLLTPQ